MRIIDWSSDVCSSDLDFGRCVLYAVSACGFPDGNRFIHVVRNGNRRADQQFDVLRAHLCIGMQDGRAFDDIAKLAYIARPVIGGQHAHRGGCETGFGAIVRASFRERGGQYVSMSWGAVSLKKKK